jgi:hypothetical protein
MIAKLVVTLLGMVAITWVNWYFQLAGRRRRGP